MRSLMIGAFLGAALYAQQGPPPPPEQPAQAAPAEDSKPFVHLSGDALARAKEKLKELMEPGGNSGAAPQFTIRGALPAGRPCAVVRNIMRLAPEQPPASAPGGPHVESPARIRVYPPAGPDRFPIKEVPMPAPSCDDVKK